MLPTLANAAGMSAPGVWMMPPASQDGRCFRELFQKPDSWKDARSRVQVLGYADHMLNRQFKDDDLRSWFGAMNKWGLKLGLEVGAVKEWGPTGEAAFNAERPMWDRFQSLGGRIHAFAMDEPLCCVRQLLKKPDAYAVDETARFITLVRKRYPNALIGDVEAYPHLSFDDLVTWIDALQAKLKESGVRGLDFFRVDVDWVNFVRAQKGSWPEVKRLESACRERGIPFSLIYWAADYPHMQSIGFADDSTWYISIMRQANDYVLVGGSPDEYVIESWVGAPSRSVPEGDSYTFTNSVRDFCRRYVRKR